MNKAVEQMLKRYDSRSYQEHEQVLREVLQEITLVGLWRGKFFEHAAFYGGTALRIFYNLDRFSEDLDFTLLVPNSNWSWHPYSEAVKKELSSYGFEATFIQKEKNIQTPVKSAFLKTQTVNELLKIGIHSDLLKGVHPDTSIRIRVEIDTDPLITYTCEQKFLSQPIPVSIKCVDEACLFAGKMHAALYRAWKGRVKGRDWYDIVWFIRKKTALNLTLFSELNGLKNILTHQEFLNMARERIHKLDIPSAIEDIIHFVRDKDAVKTTWSKDFFLYWIDSIHTI